MKHEARFGHDLRSSSPPRCCLLTGLCEALAVAVFFSVEEQDGARGSVGEVHDIGEDWADTVGKGCRSLGTLPSFQGSPYPGDGRCNNTSIPRSWSAADLTPGRQQLSPASSFADACRRTWPSTNCAPGPARPGLRQTLCRRHPLSWLGRENSPHPKNRPRQAYRRTIVQEEARRTRPVSDQVSGRTADGPFPALASY